jgi:hypothetical protein
MVKAIFLLAFAASSMAAGFAFGLDGVQEWIGIAGAVQGAALAWLVSE